MLNKKELKVNYLIVFLNTLFLTTIFYLYLNKSYEDKLYQRLIRSEVSSEMDKQEGAIALREATYNLLWPRLQIWVGFDGGIKDKLFGSSDSFLNTGQSGCGTFSIVLCRALEEAGYEVRIAQMKVGNVWGKHIVSEAKIDDRWVVLDPLFNLSYFKEDSTLASFSEIGANWEKYKLQTNSFYDGNFYSQMVYEDVRYTNWNKIPLIMPLIKSSLNMIIGEDRADQICLRSYFLNTYKAWLFFILIIYLPIFLFSLYRVIRKVL